MKRQLESTTEDLDNAGDPENRGDVDDDDMKELGAVDEEPMMTIGVNGETLDESESVEEFYVDNVNGGFLDLEMVREARVEELGGSSRCRCIAVSHLQRLVPTKFSRRGGSTQTKGTSGLQKFVASWW